MFKRKKHLTTKGVKMAKRKKKETGVVRVILNSILDPQDWWFWVGVLLALACIAMFFMIFMWPEKFKLVEFGPWLYLSYLGGYTATKEIGSWVFRKRTIKRPGDLVVFLWALFGTILWWWSFLDSSRQIPDQLGGTISIVIGIFTAGKASRVVKNRIFKGEDKE